MARRHQGKFRLAIQGNFFTVEVVGHSKDCPGQVTPGKVQEMWMWHFGPQFSREHGGAGITVGVPDPGGVFQPK